MFIEPRKAVSVDELMHGMIVQSGNDASIALAELVAGSEEAFVEKMNARGGAARPRRHALRERRPGCRIRSTTRPPPTRAARRGADPRLSGVLSDLFAEGIPLQQHHAAEPQPAAVDRPVRRRHEDRPHRRRRLVPDRVGEARRSPAASPSCSARTPTRRARPRAQKLLNWGFQAFDTVALYQSGKPVSTLRVWKGAAPDVQRGLPRRPLPDAAEGQGRQARAHARSAGAAGGAGARAGSRSAW